MKILVLIPARAGSKRVPRKNIRLLGEKPLIVWSIDIAKEIPEVCDIFVSTDDIEIANVSKVAGAYVPWLRPAELSTDTAASIAVILHALNWYELHKGVVDGILLLQPTSPFRSVERLLYGIELFKKNHGQSVISVSPARPHPLWCFEIKDNLLYPCISNAGFQLRSQDLPPAYTLNGAFYFSTPESIRNNKSFFSEGMIPLIMENQGEAIDIDTEFDWDLAKFYLNKKSSDK